MFETKTPVKERAKVIECYKQTQTTKQQDGKRNKNKTNKQTNKGNKQTLKQDKKDANQETDIKTSKVANINKQTNENQETRKRDITNKQANSKLNCEVNKQSKQQLAAVCPYY